MTGEDAVLAVWQVTTQAAAREVVIPDGCRDVILRTTPDGRRACFLTSLDDRARCVDVGPGETLVGIRFRPGAAVDGARLLAAGAGQARDAGDLVTLARECARMPGAVLEALEALAVPAGTVRDAARGLGVSARTLQRHLDDATGRPPGFWLGLGRARQAGRLIVAGDALAEVAAVCGYADQAHMSRAVRAWFGVPPGALRRSPDLCRRLGDSGYG